MKVYTFTRAAIVTETYKIKAKNEDAAREMLFNPPEPEGFVWQDWYTDDYKLQDVSDANEATP